MMVDVLTSEQRQLNMSRIRSRDTKPEMLIRQGLHVRGFRYRLHDSKLPGRPDLVFPSRHAVIFVHGCFWHGHDCPMFKLPATRSEFWGLKIASNRARDRQVNALLLEHNWRVANVWECSLRGPGKLSRDEVLRQCEMFLLSDKAVFVSVRGTTEIHDRKK